MATSAFVTAARARGASDAQIADYLAQRTGNGTFVSQARAKGASDGDIVSYLDNKPMTVADPNASVKPEDVLAQPDQALGFLNGGAKPFNNVLHWGSDALQKLGVPASMVHNIGTVVRRGTVGNIDAGLNAAGVRQGPIPQLPNNDQINQLNANAQYQGKYPGIKGKIAGSIGATAPLAVASAAALPEESAVGVPAALSRIVAGRGLAGATLSGAEQGLLNTNDPDNAGQAAIDTGLGGLGGAAFHVGGQALGKAVFPVISQSAKNLLNAGVDLTPGQAKGGMSQVMEDVKTSGFPLGMFVKARQGEAVDSANNAVLNDALGHIGTQLPDGIQAGHDAHEFTQGAFDQFRDNLTPQLQADTNGLPGQVFASKLRGTLQKYGVSLQRPPAPQFDDFTKPVGPSNAIPSYQQANAQYQAALAAHAQTPPQAVVTGPSSLMNGKQQALADLVNNEVLSRFKQGQGVIQGQDAADLSSTLGKISRGNVNNLTDNATQEFGHAAGDIRSHFNNLIEDSTPGAAGQQYGDYRTGYAKYVPAMKAAGSRGATTGIFTPNQYKGQVLSQTGSDSAKAAGTGLNQGLADDLTSVLNRTVGDSGTGVRTGYNRFLENLTKGMQTTGATLATGAVPFAASAATGHGLNPFTVPGVLATAGVLGTMYAPYASKSTAAMARALLQGGNAVREGAPEALDKLTGGDTKAQLVLKALPRTIANLGTRAILSQPPQQQPVPYDQDQDASQ